MLISSKKTLAALTALAKEEENVGMINGRPEAVKDWWFQSVRAGYPLLGLFLPVEHVFLKQNTYGQNTHADAHYLRLEERNMVEKWYVF